MQSILQINLQLNPFNGISIYFLCEHPPDPTIFPFNTKLPISEITFLQILALLVCRIDFQNQEQAM